MVKVVVVNHGCARCLRIVPRLQLTRSRHTGNYYCRDYQACELRFQKRQRELAKKEGVARTWG